MSSDPSGPCPCGSGAAYPDCCGRWHDGPEAGQQPTAEALMRSRYSAFVLDRRDVLLSTWHARTRPAELEAPPPGLRWLGLTVKAHRVLDDTHATVHFVARSKLGGRAHRLEETSRFVREGGRWFYVDGDLHGEGAAGAR
jgi:SEC-C motif-containing protein